LVQKEPKPQLLGAQVPPQPSLPQTLATQFGVQTLAQSAGQHNKFSPIDEEQRPSPHFRGTKWTELSHLQQAVLLQLLALVLELQVSTETQAVFAIQLLPVHEQCNGSQFC
jgi:hypothetical protein